ncbi:MAG: glycerol-3-phosphate 1-O-acyltransferase PlsY [candidate division Zixibacteria bacterium]|nr:glycerol-3-phosphate 1-O-acyltransferase PlsY [candidate division Zixibacteria bacterium]
MTITWVWLLAFLLGSIPFGLLLAKTRRVDLRQHGSGNIGATNVVRTLGKAAGLLTLFGDAGKGYLGVWIAGQVLETPWAIAGAGLMAYLGHVYSIFLKFKGGKGVATGLGIYLYLMPLSAMSAVGVFILVLALTRYVSIGSMLGAASIPLSGLAFNSPDMYIYLGWVTLGITVWRHRENIQRLRQGTEGKF